MARLPRITIPSFPHHLIQRGNNRQAIFFYDEDRRFYLRCLLQAKINCQCRIYSYVLMTNHVHLLVEPCGEGHLGRLMQSVGRRYVRYVNQTYGRSGTLWEGRFKSAVVSRDEYLAVCSRYIELNPVRAGMVKLPGDYPWSSYGFRALGRRDPLLDEDPWYLGVGDNPEDRRRIYQGWIASGIQERELDEIRDATQRGHIIGREKFQREIEVTIGRRVVGETRGRPKKEPAVGDENVL